MQYHSTQHGLPEESSCPTLNYIAWCIHNDVRQGLGKYTKHYVRLVTYLCVCV